ncbi:MAG: colanic acid/amylovoran biosynthesis protein [Paracoccaceae bacterium]|jgi:colanic acid/amylovoran biosynthesis protein
MTLSATLKRALKPTVSRISDLWLTEVLARLSPPRKASPGQGRHFAVLAPAVWGNTGDAAIIESFLARLHEAAPDARITLIVFAHGDRDRYAYLGVETASLQGFFGMTPKLSAMRAMTALNATISDFVILGTDVLDGGYGESASIRRLYLGVLAQRAGAAVSAVGFSFSDRATPGLTAFMAAHCRDFAIINRDAVSAARVAAVLGRPVPSGADIAFLLPVPDAPTPAAAPVMAKVDAWRAEGRRVVMFNVNPVGLANAAPNIDIAACARASAETLRLIGAAGPCAVVLATHDTRDGVADFMSGVMAQLPADLPAALLHGLVRPGDFKLLCARADLTLTGRMHMGIASLGVGTPAMFQDYQGKVEGLLGLFDAPELKYAAADALAPERLAAMALDRMDRKAEISGKIEARLPAIRALSARNIDMAVNGSVKPDA